MDKQHEHIVRSYEEELSLLNNKVAKMGGLAEQVLGQSIEALERRDPELAASTINEDEAVDALQREIEELIDVLKQDYTIAIVTHNMQQAARTSDFTAFMYLGELVEFDETTRIFTNPKQQRTQDYITGRFG